MKASVFQTICLDTKEHAFRRAAVANDGWKKKPQNNKAIQPILYACCSAKLNTRGKRWKQVFSSHIILFQKLQKELHYVVLGWKKPVWKDFQINCRKQDTRRMGKKMLWPAESSCLIENRRPSSLHFSSPVLPLSSSFLSTLHPGNLCFVDSLALGLWFFCSHWWGIQLITWDFLLKNWTSD